MWGADSSPDFGKHPFVVERHIKQWLREGVKNILMLVLFVSFAPTDIPFKGWVVMPMQVLKHPRCLYKRIISPRSEMWVELQLIAAKYGS